MLGFALVHESSVHRTQPGDLFGVGASVCRGFGQRGLEFSDPPRLRLRVQLQLGARLSDAAVLLGLLFRGDRCPRLELGHAGLQHLDHFLALGPRFGHAHMLCRLLLAHLHDQRLERRDLHCLRLHVKLQLGARLGHPRVL